MAIGVFTQQAVPNPKSSPIPKPPVHKAKPGGLYIRDTFMPSFGTGMIETPHGQLVFDSTKATQFKGQIVSSFGDSPDPSKDMPAYIGDRLSTFIRNQNGLVTRKIA